MDATIGTVIFGQQLKAAVRLAGKYAGDAVWSFKNGILEIAWGGAIIELEGRGSGAGVIQVSKADMRGIARLVTGAGETALRVEGDRLWVGSTSIQIRPKERAHEAVRPPVTVNASFWDVLMMARTQDQPAIEQAGLAGAVSSAETRRKEMVERAARALEELRVPVEVLERWVEAHLEARAQGKQTFPMGQALVMEAKTGQVRLFAERLI